MDSATNTNNQPQIRQRKKLDTATLGGRAGSASIAMMSMNTYRSSFPLQNIKTDPRNPRAAQLQAANVNPGTVVPWSKQEDETQGAWGERFVAYIESLDPFAKAEWESLYELASSILLIGLCQPIVLNSKSSQILAGERRYWASMLAGKPDAPVILRDVSDSDAAGVRFAENFMRRGLPLGAEIDSIRAMVDGLVMEGKTNPFDLGDNLPTAKELSLLTGIKPTNAYYYLKFLELDNDHPVVAQVNNGGFAKIYKAYQALKSHELAQQEIPAAPITEPQSSAPATEPTAETAPAGPTTAAAETNTAKPEPVPDKPKAPKKHKPRIALPPLGSLKQLARLIDLLRVNPEFNQCLKPSQLYHLDKPEGLQQAQKELKAAFALLDE